MILSVQCHRQPCSTVQTDICACSQTIVQIISKHLVWRMAQGKTEVVAYHCMCIGHMGHVVLRRSALTLMLASVILVLQGQREYFQTAAANMTTLIHQGKHKSLHLNASVGNVSSPQSSEIDSMPRVFVLSMASKMLHNRQTNK